MPNPIIIHRIGAKKPEFLRWQDLVGEARKLWELNEEYIRAGAGRVTKAGLCMGIEDDGTICKHNARRGAWCGRHVSQAPRMPTPSPSD